MADAREQANNPYSDGELVIYTAEEDHGEVEPATESLEKLGLISWSLWVRYEEDGVELPIVGESSNHVWFSISSENFHPDPAQKVSDEFCTAITEMVQGDGDEWGDVEPGTWSKLPDIEKYIVNLVRHGFLMMDTPEPALVIDYCTNRVDSDVAVDTGGP